MAAIGWQPVLAEVVQGPRLRRLEASLPTVAPVERSAWSRRVRVWQIGHTRS